MILNRDTVKMMLEFGMPCCWYVTMLILRHKLCVKHVAWIYLQCHAANLQVEAQRPHEPLQAVAQYIDKMKLGIVKPNVFSYFVLREVAMLHHDKGISESARVSITEHMRAFRHGDILSAAQTEQAKQSSEYVQQEDGNTLIESLAHVPDELLPPDDHSIHWKGYYASDEDDTW